MARIKAVINERRLAYEGAVKIAEQQMEEHFDKVVLNHQVTQFKTERKYLQRRREYEARKEAKRLKLSIKEEGPQDATGSVSETIVDVSPPEHVEKEATEEPLHAEAKPLGAGPVEETLPDIPSTQSIAVDAAKVGLFGGDVQSSSKPHQ
jgi:large subunit ribosomal protein L47